MAGKRNFFGKEKPLAMAVGIGVGCSYILTLLGTGLWAWLIGNGSVAQSAIGYGSMVILAVSAAVGCMLASRIFPRKQLMVCGITAAGYYLCLLATTALFFGGQYRGMGVTALMVLLGAALAMLPALTGMSRKHKVKIPGYR